MQADGSPCHCGLTYRYTGPDPMKRYKLIGVDPNRPDRLGFEWVSRDDVIQALIDTYPTLDPTEFPGMVDAIRPGQLMPLYNHAVFVTGA